MRWIGMLALVGCSGGRLTLGDETWRVQGAQGIGSCSSFNLDFGASGLDAATLRVSLPGPAREPYDLDVATEGFVLQGAFVVDGEAISGGLVDATGQIACEGAIEADVQVDIVGTLDERAFALEIDGTIVNLAQN